MDLRQLQCFVAAAEELNFSRAAARVHISQPPFSRQIARLETDLDVRLFDRSPHAVVLTQAGRALLGEARRLLAQADALPALVKRAERGETGRLRIGFVGSTLYTAMPALVGKYRRSYPGVEVGLQQATVTQQARLLLAGEIDLGIIRQTLDDTRFALRSFFKEPFLAALPAHHPLTAKSSLSLRALAGEDFVAFSQHEAPAIREQMRRICEAAGFVPRIVQEAYPMSTVVGLVAAGAGVALVPASMQRLSFPDVAYRPLRGVRANSEFFLAWRRGDGAPALVNFLALESSIGRRLFGRGRKA